MHDVEAWRRMAKVSNDFLEFLSENDPFGLLNKKPKSTLRANRSVLLNNFEEIVNFFEEKGRVPQNSTTDIKEFQLYCRLKNMRSNPSFVKELKEFDLNGLLTGAEVSDMTFEDLLGDDPLNLLGGDYDESIFTLTNVRKSERIMPEYISRRKFCQDFENYQPLFEAIHHDLETGTRKLAIYHPEELTPKRFYVLGGIILYLKSVDGKVSDYEYVSGSRKRFDGRTEIIFDNGTASDMLYRSLDKALQKDGYAITGYEETTMAAEDVTDDDNARGFVYVLKSRHAKLKNVPDIYKIGSTTTSVTERIRNAVNEPTYLYAGVDIVETYRCYNMGARELEDRVHSFFDKVRLNINIPDEHGAVISPREWFCVNLDVISEAIDLIIQNKETEYVYDPSLRRIIAKQAQVSASEEANQEIIHFDEPGSQTFYISNNDD